MTGPDHYREDPMLTPEQIRELSQLITQLPDSPWFLVDCEGDLQLWLESAVKDITRDADGNVTGYRLPAQYPIEALVAEWMLETWDEGEDEQEDQFRAYARFMAAARTAVPALLAELKRLQAEQPTAPGTRPTIVCLCGSTRFYDAFQQANYDLTMQGKIVLSVGFYPHAKAEHGHGEGVGHDSAEKIALDELHKRKIDLADEVLVLNVGGYIGESTRSEIAYAEKVGRPVRYLEGDGTR
jgi:hypothetical protein